MILEQESRPGCSCLGNEDMDVSIDDDKALGDHCGLSHILKRKMY